MKFKTYKEALRIRMIEEEIARRYSEQEMRCPVHLSIGQELNAVELCEHLGPHDLMISGHRAHAHYLAKGGNLNALIAELYGKSTGCSGGFGGSMHLVDRSCSFMGSTSIVASTVPVGVGLAWKKHLRKEPGIVVICIGDAALEEGVVHESMNFASLHKLKVLFFCENNYYSCYTHLRERQAAADLSSIAVAYDMDVAYSFEGAAQCADVEPTFMVVPTYRFVEHCGPNNDDKLRYRPEAKEQTDPLTEMAKEFSSSAIAVARSVLQMEIDQAFRLAKEAPFPAKLMEPLCEH